MNTRASPELPDSPRELKKPRMEDPRPPLKYIHVHHFKTTKLFGAWFNDPTKSGKKVRLFFGSHLTAYLAARAQDRAALKYKSYALDPRSIKLNFKEEDYVDDQKLRDMLTCEEFGELLRKESRPKYTKMEPTRCLHKFLAHERSRGNIPSEVSPTEDIISLNQYLKEVIGKRKQLDEDMEDPVPTNEDSSENEESTDEEMEDPVPTNEDSSENEESSDEEMEDPISIAEQKKHALKVERKKRNEGKRIVVSTKPRPPCSPVPVWDQMRKRSNWKRQDAETSNRQYKLQKLHLDPTKKSCDLAPPIKLEDLSIEVENTKKRNEGKCIVVSTKPRPPRSLVAGPSKCKPSIIKHDPLPVWGQTRKRSNWKHQEDETSNRQYKLQKLHLDSTEKSHELAPPVKPDDLPTEVEDTKSLEGAPIEPEDLSIEVENMKSLEGALIELDGLSIEVKNGLPKQFRSRWHYKMHKIQKLRQNPIEVKNTKTPGPTEVENTKTPGSTEVENTKTLGSTEDENTKTPELGTEGLPSGSEFPKLQFRSRWHYKQHKIQKLQTSRTNEPSATIVEDSCIQALAETLLSQVEKLV